MKVVIYMAMTPNGLIARANHETDFVSKTEWASFEAESKKARNVVYGKTTFDVCRANGEFPFKGRYNVVMTRQKVENPFGDQVLFTDKKPAEIVQTLGRMGFDTVFVAGGGTINAAFLNAGVVDEIVLDVMPEIFGKGVPLFAHIDFGAKLRLIRTEKLSRDEIQLRYKVDRKK